MSRRRGCARCCIATPTRATSWCWAITRCSRSTASPAPTSARSAPSTRLISGTCSSRPACWRISAATSSPSTCRSIAACCRSAPPAPERRIACPKASNTCTVSRVRSTPRACATRCWTPRAGCVNACPGRCRWPTSQSGKRCRPVSARRPSWAARMMIVSSACASPAARRRPAMVRRRRCCRPSGRTCRCLCGSACAGSTSG